MSIFNDVGKLLVQYVDLKARQYTSEAFEETRRIIFSLLIFAASGLFWAVGIVFLFGSLFFRLSRGLIGFWVPAAETGLAAFIVGALLTAVAIGSMRRPAEGHTTKVQLPRTGFRSRIDTYESGRADDEGGPRGRPRGDSQ